MTPSTGPFLEDFHISPGVYARPLWYSEHCYYQSRLRADGKGIRNLYCHCLVPNDCCYSAEWCWSVGMGPTSQRIWTKTNNLYLISTLLGFVSALGSAYARSFGQLIAARLFNGFFPAAMALGTSTVVDLFFMH